jgi:hypothetical protein
MKKASEEDGEGGNSFIYDLLVSPIGYTPVFKYPSQREFGSALRFNVVTCDGSNLVHIQLDD